MTENKEKMPEKGSISQKKKWLLISLCSAALLGGAVGYGIYNNQSSNQSNQKIEQKSSASKGSKKESAWEKQVAPKKKQKTKESKSADDVLSVVVGDKKENSLFGVQMPSGEEKQGLAEKLAVAIDDQSKKEDARKASEVVHAAEVDKAPAADSNLIKGQIPDKGINEETSKEQDVDNDSKPIPDPVPNPNPIPDPTPNPNPDPNPNPNPTPTPDPDPDPTPTPDPDPSVDELITKSKEELSSAADKANEVNERLTKVKSELDSMQNVKSNTQVHADKAAEQWDKVQSLIEEYNQLSDELKQLMDQDGTVPEVNVDLYKEAYEKLNQKVNEIKDAQDSANSTTNQMNSTIQNAQETLDQMDQTKSEYQETQAEVSDATRQVTTAITNANNNDQVSSAVQLDINQAAVSSSEMNATNVQVGNQLDEINSTEMQETINNASQSAQAVNDQAAEQNEAVSDVVNDFNNFPKPEAETNPETPVTPDQSTSETQPQASTDQTTTQEATASANQGSEVVAK
ncbi:hypothetical protein FQS87_08085 [Enterococcus avium]|uniref:hypothetical protein n=1 Tax=Enterococcus TaxID=1350 RepID=UPI001A96C1BC|nr:hypothetical protein [Enterococcus avium]MBO1139854.1 hypothetical protein [Enterococcus avium]